MRFVNRTKPGTALIETALTGDLLYLLLLKIPSGKAGQSSTLTVQTVLDYVFGRLDIAALDSTTNDHRIWMDDDIGLSLARNAYS